jgi:cyclophilin family peptidyl-prolyl cis-trans isomerase
MPQVEKLECRALFTATLTSAIAPVSAYSNANPAAINLLAHFDDPTVTGTAVMFQSSEGNIPLDLYNKQAPQTVANFLSYVNGDSYDGTVLQRVIPGFLLQGGGYLPDQTHIATNGTIPSEAKIPNTTGTISMVVTNGPASATSDWLINLGNNTFFNTSAAGGPLTVFGQVIYGGMNVVNQIVNLPKGQAAPTFVPSTGDPAGGTLPLQNYSGGTVTPANYVMLQSAQVVPALTFTAVSDNTSLVMPSISGGTLTFNDVAGQTGTANVTVQATDLGGNVVSTTFSMTVTPPPPRATFDMGPGNPRLLRFTDADGTAVQVRLSGSATAALTMEGNSLGGVNSKTSTQIVGALKPAVKTGSGPAVWNITGSNLQITDLNLTGTTADTVVQISGSGGNDLVNIANITSTGSLAALMAPNTDLTGYLIVTGTVGNVLLGQVGTSDTPATVSATSVNQLSVAGDCSANLTATRLGIVDAGSISTGTWVITGAALSVAADSLNGLTLTAGRVGRIAIKDTITGLALNSTGNIASVAAGGLSNSQIEVGDPALDYNDIATNFAEKGTISSLTLGSGGFSNSIISAPTLGSVNLGAFSTSNDYIDFGLAADHVTLLKATLDGKPLTLKNVRTAQQVTAALTAKNISLNDVVLRVV